MICPCCARSWDGEAPIGYRLGQLRRKAGVVQKRIAALAGTTATTISDVERGRHAPSPRVLGAYRRAGIVMEEMTP